jgi:hypothetical protein
MRTFIRHPSDIPIEVHSENVTLEKNESLENVSLGGVCFRADSPMQEDSVIKVKIAFVKPVFEAKGKVVWCKKENDYYDIGVEFLENQDIFRIRMVEQICRIESYKKEVMAKEGRTLSGTEAALEWITKYADGFQDELSRG